MTLQAKIMTVGTIAIAGEPAKLAQLSDAVEKFNEGYSNLVTMEEWPGPRQLRLDRVAGQASLHLDNDSIIASVELQNTPMGRIAGELVENNVTMYLRPVAVVIPANNQIGRRLKIERLVIVTNPESPVFETPLKIVQDWVNGEVHTPMYQLKDK